MLTDLVDCKAHVWPSDGKVDEFSNHSSIVFDISIGLVFKLPLMQHFIAIYLSVESLLLFLQDHLPHSTNQVCIFFGIETAPL